LSDRQETEGFEIDWTIFTQTGSRRNGTHIYCKNPLPFGENWAKHNENETIEAMVTQLLLPVQRFIKYKAMPTTYSELTTRITEYEGLGMKDIDAETKKGMTTAEKNYSED